jgi:hypothetical protein
MFKAARLQIPAIIFMKILKMYKKVKNCEAEKVNNTHIAQGTNNPCKLPERTQNMQN